MRSLSAILSRPDGHEALLELVDLDTDVKALRDWLVKIGNRVADSSESIDERARDDLVGMVGRAAAVTLVIFTSIPFAINIFSKSSRIRCSKSVQSIAARFSFSRRPLSTSRAASASNSSVEKPLLSLLQRLPLRVLPQKLPVSFMVMVVDGKVRADIGPNVVLV